MAIFALHESLSQKEHWWLEIRKDFIQSQCTGKIDLFIGNVANPNPCYGFTDFNGMEKTIKKSHRTMDTSCHSNC